MYYNIIVKFSKVLIIFIEKYDLMYFLTIAPYSVLKNVTKDLDMCLREKSNQRCGQFFICGHMFDRTIHHCQWKMNNFE